MGEKFFFLTEWKLIALGVYCLGKSDSYTKCNGVTREGEPSRFDRGGQGQGVGGLWNDW